MYICTYTYIDTKENPLQIGDVYNMHHIHIPMDTNENIQQFVVELVGQVYQQMLPLKTEENVKLNENKKQIGVVHF